MSFLGTRRITEHDLEGAWRLRRRWTVAACCIKHHLRLDTVTHLKSIFSRQYLQSTPGIYLVV